MFDPGVAIALELIALSVGSLVIIACHASREDTRLNVFPKFVGYFTVIIAFIALIGSLIACFSYWMDMGGTVKSRKHIDMPVLLPTTSTDSDIHKIPPSPTPTPTPTPTPADADHIEYLDQ